MPSPGPFAGMAGNWSGGGTVTLDDGSNERIRCRATYQVGGPNMEHESSPAPATPTSSTCTANVVDQGGAVSGTWSETSRNVSGSLQGRGGGGNFQVMAVSAPASTPTSRCKTTGNKQTVTMRADSQFRGANISLSK